MVEGEVDMATGGEYLEEADVQKIHCMAKVSSSTPGPVAAYLHLEEDNCATYRSRLTVYGG